MKILFALDSIIFISSYFICFSCKGSSATSWWSFSCSAKNSRISMPSCSNNCSRACNLLDIAACYESCEPSVRSIFFFFSITEFLCFFLISLYLWGILLYKLNVEYTNFSFIQLSTSPERDEFCITRRTGY